MDIGASYQGSIKATYHRLEKAFGIPFVSKEPVVCPVEWCLIFDRQISASLYLRYGSPTVVCPLRLVRAQIWHVGGSSEVAVECVAQWIKCREFTCLSDELRISRASREPGNEVIPF